jgi:hypothetical protein
VKHLFLILSILPNLVFGNDEPNVLAGVYSSCVRWTTMGGVETSKRFELIFTPDSALHLTAAFFVGSEKCEGEPGDLRRYENFRILADNGNRPFRKITAQPSDSEMYFEFILTPGTATIYTDDFVPVRHNMMRMMILNRPR